MKLLVAALSALLLTTATTALPAQSGDRPVVECRFQEQIPLRISYQIKEPALSAQGVGWRVQNPTADRYEVKLEKRYYAGNRLVKVVTSTTVLAAGETLSGSRFFGDSALWDDLFYPDDLRKGEQVTRVGLQINYKKLSR
jgi:hypothetical protein